MMKMNWKEIGWFVAAAVAAVLLYLVAGVVAAPPANAALICTNFEQGLDITPEGMTATWYVGQSPTVLNQVSVFVKYEADLQCMATDAEKVYLRNHFANLKWRNNIPTLIFTGDDARFILNNL